MFAKLLRTAAASAALVLVAGCESTPPEPIHRESLQQVTATVVDVQKSGRRVTLRNPDGSVVTAAMGPEVRNFDQIQVGDSVVASYYEEVNFAVQDAGQDAQPGAVALGAGRTKAGERPGMAVGAAAETTVTFRSYDETTRIVTFTDEAGRARAATVRRSDGHEFAKRLNAGDRVVITAAEMVAVSVESAK